ncbi:MAG: hypothetical protein U0269_33445 [Polyangiales bacterium]
MSWASRAAITVGVVAASVGMGAYRKHAAENQMIASVPAHPSLTRDDRLRIARAIERSMGAILSDPTLDAQMSRALGAPLRTPAERNRAAQTLSARGISGLAVAQLSEVFAVKLALARSSPLVCAGMWNGRVDQSEVFAALARLPQPQMERWMQLSADSVRVALRPGFVVANEDQSAIDAVISAAAARMDEPRRTRFQQTIDQGPEAPPLEGCSAWTALLEAARDSEPALRERFYRTMARP